MADGVQLNAGTGPQYVDSESNPFRSGWQMQRVKVVLGGIDQDGGDVTAANPLPTMDVAVALAQSGELPIAVTLMGDPNGEFAGVNLLDQLFQPNGATAFIQIVNPAISVSAFNVNTPAIVPGIQNSAYAAGNCMGGLQTVNFFRTASQP